MEDKYSDPNNNYSEGASSGAEQDVVTKAEIADIKKMDRMGQLKKTKLIAGIVSAVLGGVLTAAVFFTQPKDSPFRAASLIAGIPLALLGLFIFLRPSFLIEFIPIVVGAIVLLDGIMNLLETFDLMKQKYSKWWVSLIFAALTITMGILLIMRPFGVAKFVMQAIGVIMLYNGLSDIFIASRIKTKIKDI